MLLPGEIKKEEWIKLNSNYEIYYRKIKNIVEFYIADYTNFNNMAFVPWKELEIGVLSEEYRPDKLLRCLVEARKNDNSTIFNNLIIAINTNGKIVLQNVTSSGITINAVTGYFNYII